MTRLQSAIGKSMSSLFIEAAFNLEIVYVGRGDVGGEIDGVRISFDERLDVDEHRLLHTEEAEDDEREPPVDIKDGAYDNGDSSGGVTDVLLVANSIDFGIDF